MEDMISGRISVTIVVFFVILLSGASGLNGKVLAISTADHRNMTSGYSRVPLTYYRDKSSVACPEVSFAGQMITSYTTPGCLPRMQPTGQCCAAATSSRMSTKRRNSRIVIYRNDLTLQYSRNFLLRLRSKTVRPITVGMETIKKLGILRYRGSSGGCKK